MSGVIQEKRELYIDVTINDGITDEIYLYQVDFFRDRSFRTKEYIYKTQEVNQEELSGDGEPVAAPPEPLELFREQWDIISSEAVPVELYATDAGKVMEYVFEPLAKKYPEFNMEPEINAAREFLHDCISMGRVISMSVFDEEQHLSSGIRRRMKERYHEYVDEVKAEHPEHIFISQRMSEEFPKLLLIITDANYKIKKQVMLNLGMKEETVAVRFREILALYPEADIIVDSATPEMYRLFANMNQFMTLENQRLMFSLESMLAALGKKPDTTDMVKTYLLYIKNHEEMRMGTFLPDRLYSIHSFYLPVQISGEKEWKQQFAKNSMWKQNGRENYYIACGGDIKGKYIVKAGKEQFVLKFRNISLHRYLKKYAVLRLEVENYFYPGEEDRKRINELASALFVGERNGADAMEIKFKDGKQTFALTSIAAEGNENQLWLNGLLSLGKKKKQKKALSLFSLKDRMYCVENRELPEEEQMVQMAIIRDGVFRKIEDSMAKAMKPEKSDRPAGSLTRRQKKDLRTLYEMYRYIVVSFGEAYETTQKNEQKLLWQTTENSLETKEVTNRLDRKFGMFF